MSKNVKENELKAKQSLALGLLLMGKTQRETASVMDLAEETISRWMNGDPAFIAAYNSGLQSLYDAGLNELLALRREAIRKLGDKLEKGPYQVKAAELILKYTDGRRPAGPTDPAAVDVDLCEAEANRKNRKAWANLGL